jgi:hypothetical protein
MKDREKKGTTQIENAAVTKKMEQLSESLHKKIDADDLKML